MRSGGCGVPFRRRAEGVLVPLEVFRIVARRARIAHPLEAPEDLGVGHRSPTQLAPVWKRAAALDHAVDRRRSVVAVGQVPVFHVILRR